MRTEDMQARGFDFSRDYRLLNQLGQALFERAKQERGDAAQERRRELLTEAVSWFDKALLLDPDNVTAHYNLALIWGQLGDETKARRHRALHAEFKPDDNARDRAVAAARLRYPAANHAAEPVVIYDLRRAEAYGLAPSPMRVARDD
jgi:tetratricopeptide (TPR) repeat protein